MYREPVVVALCAFCLSIGHPAIAQQVNAQQINECPPEAIDQIAGLASDQGAVRFQNAVPFSAVTIDGQPVASIDSTGTARVLVESGLRRISVRMPVDDTRELLQQETVFIQSGRLFCFSVSQSEEFTREGLNRAYEAFWLRASETLEQNATDAQTERYYHSGGHALFNAFPSAAPDSDFRGYSHDLRADFPSRTSQQDVALGAALDLCDYAHFGNGPSLSERRQAVRDQAAVIFASRDAWAEGRADRIRIFAELYRFDQLFDEQLPHKMPFWVTQSRWHGEEQTDSTIQTVYYSLRDEVAEATGLLPREVTPFMERAISPHPIRFSISQDSMFDMAIFSRENTQQLLAYARGGDLAAAFPGGGRGFDNFSAAVDWEGFVDQCRNYRRGLSGFASYAGIPYP